LFSLSKNETLLSAKLLIELILFFKSINKSLLDSDKTSAATEGVEALKSETKSEIVKSVSCPIAVTIGIFESNLIMY